MEHVKALLIKLVMVTAVLGIVLTGMYDGEFSDALLISVTLTIAAYLIGDLFIFRNSGNDQERNDDQVKRNVIATVSDFALAFLVIWLVGKPLFADNESLLTASFISALVIAGGEWFFHKYLDNHVFKDIVREMKYPNRGNRPFRLHIKNEQDSLSIYKGGLSSLKNIKGVPKWKRDLIIRLQTS